MKPTFIQNDSGGIQVGREDHPRIKGFGIFD
jgi:hypothetical protein